MNETDNMVRALLKKDKMLSYHCPNCNLPLFQREGVVFCVKCGPVKVVKEEDLKDDGKKKKGKDLKV
jgi:uncharacterized Zn finger protein (UPF0148 family)